MEAGSIPAPATNLEVIIMAMDKDTRERWDRDMAIYLEKFKEENPDKSKARQNSESTLELLKEIVTELRFINMKLNKLEDRS